ncbi:MAG TPA: carboxylesterase family protein [Terriglobales bacterium]|nr:carboxylesterase family protein [Terriglobales bacterium]
MKLILLAFLFIVVSISSAEINNSEHLPTVSISAGQIRGMVLLDGGANFLGVPYAQPPVGNLRWHEPVPPKSWSGVRDAKEFGAPCAQSVYGDWNRRNAENSQEDCLYLNVLTPEWPVKAPLPVMFWLHGGANTGGTASASLYKDGTLQKHGVVLVTVNYRLGVFGFLAHPELTAESTHHASGNYALMDQIAALQWVHDNIAKFGGDPNNVTVFGQSAGALDTGLLMTSPLAKGLFQRAIAESGTVLLGHWPKLSEAEQQGTQLATSLKAPSTNALKFLRDLSTTALLKATIGSSPSVIVDGWVLTHSPALVFATGQEAAIPLLLGNNTREFDAPATPDELRSRIPEHFGSLAPRALDIYGLANGGTGNNDPLYGPAANQLAADTAFRCPATTIAQWHKKAHHPTYEYQFERAIPGQESQGSVHSADLPYVFGYFPKEGNIGGKFGETDHRIAEIVESYWTNFARTGDPNGGSLPKWPEFSDTESFVSITQDGQVEAKTKLRAPQCDLYRDNIKRRFFAASR